MTKSIVIHYNNINISDKEYADRMQDLTEFCVNKPRDWPVIHCTDLHATLLDCLEKDYTWAFVNSLGHMIYAWEAFEDIIKNCEQHNCPLMSHLIYIPDQYPGIDNQFFALNLKQWQQVGCPAFEPQLNQIQGFTSVGIQRSSENFHDDYTPYWIKADSGENTYHSYTDVFGYLVVDAFLRAGYVLHNFNKEIRNKKYHLYPNNNYELINHFRLTGKLLPETDENRYPRQTLETTVYKEYKYLKTTIYPLNSESLIDIPRKYNQPLDHIIGVAGGFKTVLLLAQLGFNSNTRVTYLDISQSALDYQIYIANAWDGNLDDYWQIYNAFEKSYPNNNFSWRTWNDWNHEVQLLLNDANLNKHQFKELWQKYQELDKEYVCVDLLEDTSPLVQRIRDNPDWIKYVWISNAYDMAWSRLLLGKNYTSERFYKLLHELRDTGAKYDLEAFSVIFNTERTDYDFLF